MAKSVLGDKDYSAARLINLQAPASDNEPARLTDLKQYPEHIVSAAFNSDPTVGTSYGVLLWDNDSSSGNFDLYNLYNASTGIFTATEAGFYGFWPQISKAGTTTEGVYLLRVDRDPNTGTYSEIREFLSAPTSSTSRETIGQEVKLYLEANHKVRILAQAGNTSMTLASNKLRTSFEIYRYR